MNTAEILTRRPDRREGRTEPTSRSGNGASARADLRVLAEEHGLTYVLKFPGIAVPAYTAVAMVPGAMQSPSGIPIRNNIRSHPDPFVARVVERPQRG